MNSVRLIKQSARELSPALLQVSVEIPSDEALAFETVRDWIKEREYTKQVSPRAAFANLFATATVTSQVKTS